MPVSRGHGDATAVTEHFVDRNRVAERRPALGQVDRAARDQIRVHHRCLERQHSSRDQEYSRKGGHSREELARTAVASRIAALFRYLFSAAVARANGARTSVRWKVAKRRDL